MSWVVSWLAINLGWLAFWLVCRCAFHMGLNVWLEISRGQLLDLSLRSLEWLQVLDSPQKLVLDFSSAFPQKGAVVLFQSPGCLILVLGCWSVLAWRRWCPACNSGWSALKATLLRLILRLPVSTTYDRGGAWLCTTVAAFYSFDPCSGFTLTRSPSLSGGNSLVP